MKEFKNYHPIVNFIYFVSVIGFGCFFMHPVCLLISLISGFTYSVMLKGKTALKKDLLYMIPMVLLMAVINPLFNHKGVTILAYFPNGNPFTLESVIYGICTAVMILSVIFHFSCFNEIMTSDKFIYLFGKIMPSLSLILSMTLRFVPRFLKQLKDIIKVQKCAGRDISKGNILKRAKNGLNILSVMTTWSLENSIETADSMKSRGYGLSGRTAFSVFIFSKRDISAIIFIIVCSVYTLSGYLTGSMNFTFFPSLKWADFSFFEISVFLSYMLVLIFPIVVEIVEVIRWNFLKSKI